MTVASKASQVWDLNRGTGTAWAYCGPTGVLQAPFIVVADNGPTDMAGLAAKANDAAYDLHAAVTKTGRELILVGFTSEISDLHAAADTVLDAIMRAVAEQSGPRGLTVGGFGRGALLARYALAKMERQRMDHQTEAYFAYNSTSPVDRDETDALESLGAVPQRPRLLKLTVGVPDVEGLSEKDDQDLSLFHDAFYSNETATTSLMAARAGQWLLEELR
ncbi:hypothetical protein [Nocardia sp. NPDC058633]|uniref:hypothetical protein n=1 Tax=Nocardia sp. NPDC058633 TaxID=3346568 RepID=UPI0036644524